MSRGFSLTAFAAAGNKHRRQSTDHFGSHVTMSSNRASALYTVPGHRLSSAMSVEAVGELVEARTGSRDAQPHRCANKAVLGFRTVYVDGYASTVKICFELLATVPQQSDLATVWRRPRV